jgi:virginiamycin A acetyltransferase
MNLDIHPDPKTLYPIEGVMRTCYLKNIITNPQISIGDYTYYDDPESIHNFEKNVLYLFPFVNDRLIIGKFCQIASGVKFIMNGANHALNGFSTYPFSWKHALLNSVSKGNTIVDNDVWIGNSATIMPGITIGNGAIIGAHSLVTKDVEPYSIVGGNPAKPIRKRFDDETIALLLDLKWWDWPIEKISENLEFLVMGDLESLKAKADL